MKVSLTILGCLIVAALLSWALAAAPGLPSMRKAKRWFGYPAGQIACNALGDGKHPHGRISLLADAAHSARHLLVKRGSDADHMAVISAASDEPLGVCYDEPEAAEDGGGVQLLGACKETATVTASEAITAGQWLYSNGDGKVQNEPAVAGTYWLVGKAVTAASGDGIQLEMEPITPIKFVVLAVLASTDGTAGAAADLAALKAEAEKIGDDLRRIAAAMDGKTFVKVLTA